MVIQKHYSMKISSPVGFLTLICNEHALTSILWENEKMDRIKLPALIEENTNHPLLCETQKQLHAYFQGTLTHFTLPIKTEGTSFQKSVWEALTAIAYGETKTYQYIARAIKNEKAVRAVGAAIGANPISIIIPCHRVIGSNGKLTGFAGGLETKATLLGLEQKKP